MISPSLKNTQVKSALFPEFDQMIQNAKAFNAYRKQGQEFLLFKE